MPRLRGVVNHFKYLRSNGVVVMSGFLLLLSGGFVAQSLVKAGENAMAYYNNGYGSSGSSYATPCPWYNNNYICSQYNTQGSMYNTMGTYPNGGGYGNNGYNGYNNYDNNYGNNGYYGAQYPIGSGMNAQYRIGSGMNAQYPIGSGMNAQNLNGGNNCAPGVGGACAGGAGYGNNGYNDYNGYNNGYSNGYGNGQYVNAENGCNGSGGGGGGVICEGGSSGPVIQPVQPSISPVPVIVPQPSTQPVAPPQPQAQPNENNNTNTNNNNSSATATANVVVNKEMAPMPSAPTVITAGYSESGGGSAFVPKGGPAIMLPETGTDSPLLSLLGVGGLVAAGAAYALSRRELTAAIFKRN